MHSRRSHLFLLVVGLSLAGASAYAGQAQPQRHPAPAGDHLTYPATAADFRQLVSERVAKSRARVEDYIAGKQLRPEDAAALRARFQTDVDQVMRKVDEVCADGTVTHEEARAVHELAQSLRREWERLRGDIK
jgi:hypothetical protein